MITAKKWARVKFCQHNSFISMAKWPLVWRRCGVYSFILGYRYLQGRKPSSMWQRRELGYLNQSGANALCIVTLPNSAGRFSHHLSVCGKVCPVCSGTGCINRVWLGSHPQICTSITALQFPLTAPEP